jgi:hypothetical protein
MLYRVYSGPRGSAPISALDKDRLPFKELDTLEAALAWSRLLGDSGRTPLLIEGDDGTSMAKDEIAAALRYPESPARRRAT